MLIVKIRSSAGVTHTQPAQWIEFRGGVLLVSSEESPIATYERGSWIHQGRRAVHIECRGVLSISLESGNSSPATSLGPFPSIHLSDQYLFGGRARIAKLSPESGQWTRSRTGELWHLLRIVPGLPPPLPLALPADQPGR